jgi:inorganic pyrophosphatase
VPAPEVTVFVEIPAGSRNKYEQLERKKTETRGFGNRADAERVIAEARERAVT